MGDSYGGYGTLMGLVRHPELNRCGSAWVAVADPFLFLEGSWWVCATRWKRGGLKPGWVVCDGEAHGWRKTEHQVDFAQKLEAFLARHLQAGRGASH